MNRDNHGSVATYVIIALILAVITYIEFAIVEYEIAWLSRNAVMFWLILLSVVKFLLVIMFFMHLKGDDKTYSGFFTSGMIMALGTFIGLAFLFTVTSVSNYTFTNESPPELEQVASPGAPGPVAGYWAMDGEIALHAWQMRLASTVEYCLPVLHEDGCLRFAPWRPGAPLVSNRYGIPEPDVAADALLPASALALAVLPLVGFDPNGARLGMGAGWYDRTFALRQGTPAPPWLVGAAFSVQQVPSLLVEAWDVPMDALCTERDTFLFNTEMPAG